MKLHEPGYDSGRKYPCGPDRKRRKDAGTSKRSWAAKLSGAKVPLRYEKTLAEMTEANFNMGSTPDNQDLTYSASDKAASEAAPPQRINTPDTYIKEEQISD